MTSDTFPAMTPEPGYLQLAGSLTYTPWVRFDEAQMHALQYILEQVFDIEECENAATIADWREVACRPGGPITHRSNIILYKGGADGAEKINGRYQGVGVLFCREDIDQTRIPHTISYRVHLPDAEWQDQLLGCCSHLIDDLKQGSFRKLDMIRAYLGFILNDQTVWKPLRQSIHDLDGEQDL